VVQLAALFVLVVLAFELNGVWVELRHIRAEQVKNKFYTLTDEQAARLQKVIQEKGKPAELVKKKLEATSIVEGEVDIGNTVDVNVENEPLQVETSP
jgi:DNA-binding PadR family transcriptional regulator